MSTAVRWLPVCLTIAALAFALTINVLEVLADRREGKLRKQPSDRSNDRDPLCRPESAIDTTECVEESAERHEDHDGYDISSEAIPAEHAPLDSKRDDQHGDHLDCERALRGAEFHRGSIATDGSS